MAAQTEYIKKYTAKFSENYYQYWLSCLQCTGLGVYRLISCAWHSKPSLLSQLLLLLFIWSWTFSVLTLFAGLQLFQKVSAETYVGQWLIQVWMDNGSVYLHQLLLQHLILCEVFTWRRRNVCVNGSMRTRYEATIIADE